MRTRVSIAAASAVLALALGMSPARALPSTQPDDTYMVNGPVRAVVAVGSHIWVGGNFSQVLDGNGQTVATVNDLAVFDDTTGALDTSVAHIPAVTKTSGTSWVYDLSVAPDGRTVYLAGKFNRVDGSAHVNLARFDGTTGAPDAAFVPLNAPPAKSVLATDTDAYVGGKKLVAYHLDGSEDTTFGSVLAGTDSALRPGHVTEPAFRDLTLGETSDGTMLVVACQCDTLQDSSGTTYSSKAIAEIDPTTGLLRQSWVPSNLQTDSAAFGVAVIVHAAPGDPLEQVAYLAAGGSDFTAAYDVETGAQIFKTDTSGSSQTIAWFSPDDVLIVGGHFHYTESPTTPQCGQNSDPTPGCYFTPLLAAMDPSDGHVIVDGSGNPWNPGLCCKYNGPWALLETQPTTGTSQLYVGGEFTKAGGAWTCTTFGATCLVGEVKQQFVARFTEPAII